MRPQGQAKAGFYPTPPKVTSLIAYYLKLSEGKLSRFIDPCSGEGIGLKQLTDLLQGFGKMKIETFGIELDAARALKAKVNLTRCITGDFFTVRTSRQAYSLILLNPPYDSSGDQDQRLEHKFLVGCKDLLIVNGILILIIPQVRLIKLTARNLAAYYQDIKVFRFPDPEYSVYKQIVIFAKRKADNIPNEAKQAELEKVIDLFDGFGNSTLPIIEKAESPQYVLPPSPLMDNFYFIGYETEPQEALEQIKKSGLWTEQHRLDEIFAPEEPPIIRPLMPLKKGHLALLIASGFINNQILDDGKGLKLIIKGRSFKAHHTEKRESKEQTEDGDEKEVTETIEKERFDTVINAFNLNTGEFIAIK